MSRFSNLEGSIYYPSSQPTHLLSRSFNVVTAKSACLVYICFTEVYEKYCEYNLALPPSRTSFLREKYCPRLKKFSKICLTGLSHRVTQPAVFIVMQCAKSSNMAAKEKLCHQFLMLFSRRSIQSDKILRTREFSITFLI